MINSTSYLNSILKIINRYFPHRVLQLSTWIFFLQQNWQETLSDGLHLSMVGSHLLFDLLKPVVDQLTSELPMIYPDWKDVDVDNLANSLKP